MNELSESQLIQLITTIVNKHGCHIVEMDIKNHILNIDGPPAAREACARELAEWLD